MKNHIRVLIVLTVFFIANAFGQEPKILFQSDDILKLTIKLHITKVIRDVDVRDYHEATLSYIDDKNAESIHQIKLKVRGNNRANIKTCSFPPLEINFKKNKTKNSVFEGQNKLKLVTHCRNSKEFSDYVREEYMTYKMYQLLTPISFRVRLCEVTYIDLDNKKNTITQTGFLIERTKEMAQRNNMVVYKDSLVHQDVCNKTELDKLTVFQFMIGNLDWSVPMRHNIKIVAPEKGGFPIAVPYDFDHSGMVNTSYANPPEGSGITSVRSRVFRGLCRFNNGYSITFDLYQKLKPDLFSIAQNSSYLSDKSKKSVEKYLDSFYEILDDPKKVNQKIVTVCRAKHKHHYDRK